MLNLHTNLTFDEDEFPMPIEATPEQITSWANQFNRDGYLVLHDLLTPAHIDRLKADLDRELAANNEAGEGIIQLHHRLFETSKANLELFDMEPIASIAETLVGRDCHVTHNNSFRVQPGKGIATWHQGRSG